MCLLEYGRKAGGSDYADFDDEDGAEGTDYPCPSLPWTAANHKQNSPTVYVCILAPVFSCLSPPHDAARMLTACAPHWPRSITPGLECAGICVLLFWYTHADNVELDEDALVEDDSVIQAHSPSRRGSTSTSMFERKFAKLTAKDEKQRKAEIDLQMQQEEILIKVNG